MSPRGLSLSYCYIPEKEFPARRFLLTSRQIISLRIIISWVFTPSGINGCTCSPRHGRYTRSHHKHIEQNH